MSGNVGFMERETTQRGEPDPGRPRVIIDVDTDLKEAIELRCLEESLRRRRRVGKSELLGEVLRREFAKELQNVAEAPPRESPRGKKRGRKPKKEGGSP